MSKDIHTGIDKTLEALDKRRTDELNASWRDLRNKLDSMLLATNVLKSNDAMQACRVLDVMTTEEREHHILGNWGPQYLEKARPILIQLEVLEKRIKAEKESE